MNRLRRALLIDYDGDEIDADDAVGRLIRLRQRVERRRFFRYAGDPRGAMVARPARFGQKDGMSLKEMIRRYDIESRFLSHRHLHAKISVGSASRHGAKNSKLCSKPALLSNFVFKNERQ
jgi:hypothetical protein